MLSLITRVQYPDLYRRMINSALGRSSGESIEFINAPNPEGLPVITPTYNRLAERARGDILIFLHDDIEFIEDGWDARIVEFFANTDFDIAGVVGVDKYDGGLMVSAGHPHCFGKFTNRSGDEMKVNLYGPRCENKRLVAVDGMFIAVRADRFRSHKFDEKLDGLFFYDLDYCLGEKVGLLDILIAHYKPADLFGKYPEAMKTMESYEPYFYSKHGLNPTGFVGDTRSLCATQEDYSLYGHDKLWSMFREKYLANV